MQVGSTPPVIQGLVGAQETGAVRQQSSVSGPDQAKAVRAPAPSERGRDTHLATKRDPEEDDNSQPKPRGSLVDITV